MSDAHPPIKNAAELLEKYAAGERTFTGAELGAVDLRAANLRGVDLSYADLSAANLSQTNLRGADLSYANLSEANLQSSDLRGASLIGTDLRAALLETADLKEADYDPVTTRFPQGFDPVYAGMKADQEV